MAEKRTEDGEGVEHGRAKSVHHQAGREGRRDMPDGQDRPGSARTSYFNWKKKQAGIMPSEMIRPAIRLKQSHWH
jgi:hypothetical protein